MLLPHDRTPNVIRYPIQASVLRVHNLGGLSTVMHCIEADAVEIEFGDRRVLPDSAEAVHSSLAEVAIKSELDHPITYYEKQGLFNSALSIMQSQDIWTPIKEAEELLSGNFEIDAMDSAPSSVVDIRAIAEDGQAARAHLYVFGDELSDERVENIRGLFNAIVSQGTDPSAVYDTSVLMLPSVGRGFCAVPGINPPGICSDNVALVTQEVLGDKRASVEILSGFRSVFLADNNHGSQSLVQKEFMTDIGVEPYTGDWGIRVPICAKLVKD